MIQVCGLLNLLIGALFGRWSEPLAQLIFGYSLGPLLAQMAVCGRRPAASATSPPTGRMMRPLRPLPTQLARRPLLLISLVIVVIDQASKAWVCAHLQLGCPAPFLSICCSCTGWKTGAAFSLFLTPFALKWLSLLVALGVAVWIWRSRQQLLWQGLALAFLLGGTAGNGIDRWSLGHVTDFLELVPINFPIFNGADIAINLAVACFVIDALTRREHSPTPTPIGASPAPVSTRAVQLLIIRGITPTDALTRMATSIALDATKPLRLHWTTAPSAGFTSCSNGTGAAGG